MVVALWLSSMVVMLVGSVAAWNGDWEQAAACAFVMVGMGRAAVLVTLLRKGSEV